MLIAEIDELLPFPYFFDYKQSGWVEMWTANRCKLNPYMLVSSAHEKRSRSKPLDS